MRQKIKSLDDFVDEPTRKAAEEFLEHLKQGYYINRHKLIYQDSYKNKTRCFNG